jgi:hypothetical protein
VTVGSLAPALARAERRLLDQYLITCPGCGQPAAAHVDANDLPPGGRPTLVRLVCPESCPVTEAQVLDLLPVGQLILSA